MLKRDKSSTHLRGKASTIVVLAVAAVMISSALFFTLENTSPPNLMEGEKAITSPLSPSPWTYPTTTMQEPGYTNGTYIMASVNEVGHLNIYQAESSYSFYLLDEIYDYATNLLPNGTISPWLAISWKEYNLTNMSASSATSTFLGLAGSGNMTTYDPINGLYEPVKYVYQVNIRPGVQWTDYQPGSNTYVFSNHTSFNDASGNPHSHTYRYPSVTMQTYYVQSADFILSWKILNSSFDFSGEYANVVNVVPVNNLTVDYYLSNSSGTFLTYTLETPILPYHIWDSHEYSTSPGVWNYTANPPSPTGGYNNWNVSYNPNTGYAPDLVGTGPFMMNGGYGMPKGQWIFDQYWKLYVNPHYFVQYVPSLRQWTPKFYELYVPKYLSLSAAVIALTEHKVYQVEGGITPSFISTLSNLPNIYLYYKPGTGFRYLQLNSFGPGSAANMTRLYGFTPVELGTPLNITSVRQALNYAVNKQYIASVIFDGYDIPGTSLIPPSDSVWENQSLPSFSYDPAKAMALLNNTPGMKYVNGEYYYDGKQFTMNIQITSMSSDPLDVEAALKIAQWWDQIGVSTSVTQESFSTIIATENDYQFQATVDSITGIVGDPTDFFDVFYTPSGGLFYGLYFGPFSSMPLYGNSGPVENGTYFDNEMIKLYNELNSNTNLTYRIHVADEMQGIAAWQSTVINLGYPIHIFPIENATFVNITKDALGQNAFEFWNFLSLHLRVKQVTQVTVPNEQELHVGMVTDSRIYYNGQYGNATVEVRNSRGSPVAGAEVVMGFTPEGSILNISSMTGRTNSSGEYKFEFKIAGQQSLIYTSDYSGQVNLTASATMNGTIRGMGYVNFDVAPEPVAYRILNTGGLQISGMNATRKFSIEFYNPLTGSPVAGYRYSIQVNAGAINLTTVPYEQEVKEYIPGNPSNEYYYSIDNVSGTLFDNYNMTQVSGVTPSNGTVSFFMQINGTLDLKATGNFSESYIFLGNYVLGAPMPTTSPYMTIGEMTSSTNPNGFGELQPVEIPVSLRVNSTQISISLNVSTHNISTPGGYAQVNVTVTDAGSPVSNFTVQLTSQNTLGANRGFLSGQGSQVQVVNQNNLFGSLYLPGINVTTNSTGEAVAVLNASIYIPQFTDGLFTGYTGEPFTDPYLIPQDEFQITAFSQVAGVVNTTTVTSSQYVDNPPYADFISEYINGNYTQAGVILLNSSSSYTIYINSTEGSQYGPSVGNIPFNVTINGIEQNTTGLVTGSNGTYLMHYTTPKVTSPMTVIFTFSYQGHQSIMNSLVLPQAHVTAKPQNQLVPYSVAAVFAVLFAVFASLYAIEVRKRKKV